MPGRTSTPTRHCIVHHSASNNGDTNSINLVRSFYIQHKEVNGWDDIGYNFLIGHDGTVFAGRDPEKPGIQQDNVFGAHFCGKNSYTMGICVIGSFEDEAPDIRAVNALERLLTWKMFKDEMNPLDSLHHPDTINSDLLPVLAGHRNGCATECPGQLLFDQLPILRLKIADNLTQCAPLSTNVLSENNAIQFIPNPSTGQFQIRMDDNITYNYQLINSTGQLIKSGQIGNMQIINLEAQKSGIYFLKLYDNKFQKVVKLIVSY
ncbi:MAG: N-acetylmuramoyl-L-alanine amidase [Saprospiraceae bacterium]|nr:N-acetylmuramoyl-L-alanine amidase [Candidatus Brachybacter algidus]